MPGDGLSLAQRERLEMLIEECAEVITVATKVLRHGGYHTVDRAQVPPVHYDNQLMLEQELKDVFSVAERMDTECDINFTPDFTDFDEVWRRKLPWTHHQSDSPGVTDVD